MNEQKNPTVGQLLMSNDVLVKLSKQTIPSKTAFKLFRIIQKIQTELESYETSRKEIASRLGEVDEENQQFKFSDENGEKFVEELNEILTLESTVQITKLKEQDLQDVDISVSDLIGLSWLIEVEE